MIGRATKVWLTENEGVNYVVKDSWIDSRRKDREHSLLHAIKMHCQHNCLEVVDQHLPLLHTGGDVLIGGVVDSTEQVSRLFLGDPAAHRVHRRLIIKTFGAELTTFTTMRELFSVLIGAVKGSILYSLKAILTKLFY
jgi:hypothetical protein